MIGGALYLLKGTAEGIFSVILPLIEGLITFGIVVVIIFLPLLIGVGIHKLGGSKVKSK